MSQNLSRRKLIQAGAAGAGLLIIPSRLWGKGNSPNDKLNVACIGVTGKGDSDSGDCGKENVVAICDVDSGNLAKGAKRFPNAKTYTDFRKMLDEMDNQIDAVTVSTPDHTHYPAAMYAIRKKKHVFVQKPMAHDVWETRQLLKAVREEKVMSQMGNQGHSSEGTRMLKEWIEAGVIGPVREIHWWTNRPIWPQGIGRPKDAKPVPANLDWNLWLNGAPERPYHDAYCPFRWRGWWDFGCGALGDIGCHVMDAGFWALDLGAPESVEPITSPVNNETAPSWSILIYRFPARGNLPPVKAVWYDGPKRPPYPHELEADRKLNDEAGHLFFGEKGVILCDFYCSAPRLIPESVMKDVVPQKNIPKTLPRVKDSNHMGDFLRSCKDGKPSASNFEYSALLNEMVVLGNLAVRCGKKIEWDAKQMKVSNVPEANQWIHREYRKGWDFS
ncbi:MAG: Gfo/Idh/MocA family oxidoreductase [Candidatus Sumerlaeota bacterium]|nr:Gfo/Idh/MocA family oxidoreductase [Candidatus Sumerlaeota bacterium]